MPMLSSITKVSGLLGSVQIGPIGVGSGGMPGALVSTTNGTVAGTAVVVLVICSRIKVGVLVIVILRENRLRVAPVGLPGVVAVTVMLPPRLVAVAEVWAMPLPSAMTGLVVDSVAGPLTAKLTCPPGSGLPDGSRNCTTSGCANGSPDGPTWPLPETVVTELTGPSGRRRFRKPPAVA